MAKVSLSSHMKEEPLEEVDQTAEDESNAGPFLTISRQFGCYGFSLGLLLMEILNEGASPEETWRIYHRDILERLATETDMAAEMLERQRRTRPRLLVDFFRSLSGEKTPSGFQVRRRITMIIRGLAIEGHAIIIGQGGTAATADLPNRLSVRLEAPMDWRVKEVAFREGLSETKAKLQIKARDKDREYLHKLYLSRSKTKSAFGLVYNCGTFTLTQIAQHVVYAMKLKQIV